jgi:hypothetical protein
MSERTVTHTSNPVIRGKQAPETLTIAKVLTAQDSGKTFRLVGATTGADITLPALEAGLNFRFEVGALFATTAWTITAATAVIEGFVSVNYATIPAANESLITFAFGAETIGDWCHLLCDGTSWNIYGVASLAGGITVTSP